MPNPTTTTTTTELRNAARHFCDTLSQKRPIEEILSHFAFSSTEKDDTNEEEEEDHNQQVIIHEHGLPSLAPFLGRDFRGRAGAEEYFALLGKYLVYDDMRFVEFLPAVDVETDGNKNGSGGGGGGKVAVRGMARFVWKETGQGWDEEFMYMLRFDGHMKLLRYEIWADSGAAYLARRGELEGGGGYCSAGQVNIT